MSEPDFEVLRYQLVMLDPRHNTWRVFQYDPNRDMPKKTADYPLAEPTQPYWHLVRRVMRALVSTVEATTSARKALATGSVELTLAKPEFTEMRKALMLHISDIAGLERIPLPPNLPTLTQLERSEARHVVSVCPVLGDWDLWGALSGLYNANNDNKTPLACTEFGWNPFILSGPKPRDYAPNPERLYSDFQIATQNSNWRFRRFFDYCKEHKTGSKERALYLLYAPLFDQLQFGAPDGRVELVESYYVRVMGWPFFFEVCLNAPAPGLEGDIQLVQLIHDRWLASWENDSGSFRHDVTSLMAAIVEGRFRHWALRFLAEDSARKRGPDSNAVMKALPFLVPLRAASYDNVTWAYEKETNAKESSEEASCYLDLSDLWDGWHRVDRLDKKENGLTTARSHRLELAEWLGRNDSVNKEALSAHVDLGLEWLDALSREVSHARERAKQLAPGIAITKKLEEIRDEIEGLLLSPRALASNMDYQQKQMVITGEDKKWASLERVEAGDCTYPVDKNDRLEVGEALFRAIQTQQYTAIVSYHLGSGPIDELAHPTTNEPIPWSHFSERAKDLETHRETYGKTAVFLALDKLYKRVEAAKSCAPSSGPWLDFKETTYGSAHIGKTPEDTAAILKHRNVVPRLTQRGWKGTSLCACSDGTGSCQFSVAGARDGCTKSAFIVNIEPAESASSYPRFWGVAEELLRGVVGWQWKFFLDRGSRLNLKLLLDRRETIGGLFRDSLVVELGLGSGHRSAPSGLPSYELQRRGVKGDWKLRGAVYDYELWCYSRLETSS